MSEQAPQSSTRREVLTGLAAIGLATLAPGCGSGGGSGPVDLPSDPPGPGPVPLEGWTMAKWTSDDEGPVLSDPSASAPASARDAVVPGTVLTSLVANGLADDPYYGRNVDPDKLRAIDVHTTGVEEYTYWFLCRFSRPAGLMPGGRVHLVLHGVNYLADVYLDGKKATVTTLEGMFVRHRVDVTDLVAAEGEHALAVKVMPPPEPGDPFSNHTGGPDPQPSVCQGGDYTLAQIAAAQFSGGWDFVLALPDRNTGLWDKVELVVTGPAAIDGDPHIVSTIDWPAGWPDDRTTGPASAQVSTSVEVRNTSDVPIQVEVELEVDGRAVKVTRALDAGTDPTSIPVSVDVPDPQLWWPHGLVAGVEGDAPVEQPLYPVVVRVSTVSGDGPSAVRVPSDSYSCKIGIRELTSYKASDLNGRTFLVNKQRIFVRGGAWAFADAMLRHSPEDYDHQVRLHQQANLNLIRIWGGGPIERPAFYDACDRHGILVWQEFPLSADCLAGGPPTDNGPFLACAEDSIRMLRNHASLALWVGCNENFNRADVLVQLLGEKVAELDPPPPGAQGDRWAPYSTEPSAGFSDIPSAYPGVRAPREPPDGPYAIAEPYRFFGPLVAHQVNLTQPLNLYALNPEYGSVGFPVLESLKRFMDPRDLDWDNITVLVDQETYGDLPPAWRWHHYTPFFSQAADNTPANIRDVHTPDQVLLYGRPTSMQAFCEQAQAAQYQQYKALFESLNGAMWSRYSGGILWRSQCGWTGLRGGLYDSYLEPTGGLFGARQAGRAVHVQLDLSNLDVVVVNNTAEALPAGLQVRVSICDKSGELIAPPTPLVTPAAVQPYSSATVGPLVGALVDRKTFHVVRMKLVDPAEPDVVLASNLDWLGDTSAVAEEAPSLEAGAYAPLRALAPVTLEASGVGQRDGDGHHQVTLTVKNGSDTLAFFNRVRVLQPDKPAEEALLQPVFLSDNYFSLMPGEDTSISLSFHIDPSRPNPTITIEGWNARPGTADDSIPVSYT